MQVETRSRSADWLATSHFDYVWMTIKSSLCSHRPDIFSGERISCPASNDTNIFRCCAATPANYACARVVPFSCLLAKRIKNRMPVPIVFRRIVCLTGVWIHKDGLIRRHLCFADQG